MFTDECGHPGDAADRSADGHGNGDGDARHGAPGVLIVEDERVARKALRALLSASGYYAKAAESAEEALTLLQHVPPPSVALVDLNLPGMSGVDFIHHLERLNPAVRAVLMTGAGDEALAAALRQHPVRFVRKPLDFPRLLSLIGDDPGAMPH